MFGMTLSGFGDYLASLLANMGAPTGSPEGYMAGYGGGKSTPDMARRNLTPEASMLLQRQRGEGVEPYTGFEPPSEYPISDVWYDPTTKRSVHRAVLEDLTKPKGKELAAAIAKKEGGALKGAAGVAAAKGGAPAAAKAPTAPSATGWEEEFYRTHGRFPTEWDYADKMWSVDFATKTGKSPTREDWVSHAKQNVYNPERPATPEFAPGWGLDTGYGPNRPAPMGAVPAEVQIPGQKPGIRFETPRGPARAGAPAAMPAPEEAMKPEGAWGQLIPQSWDTQTTNQAFGQWLAEGGSGEPDDWAALLQAVGAG